MVTPACHHGAVNRTDRLYALAEELRRAGPRGRTSRRLAELLEVCTRTIKRDVVALQQAGLPVWSQAGPDGGYVLDAGATLPPVNFTPAQAVAVAVALAADVDAPFAADGAAALAKVVDVMDSGSRQRFHELCGRVWVRGAPATSRSTTRTIEEALRCRAVVALDYVDAAGTRTRRAVEPMILARTGDRWYLVGWCRHRDAPRWFRLDRVAEAHLTREVAPERDLAAIGAAPPGARSVYSGD